MGYNKFIQVYKYKKFFMELLSKVMTYLSDGVNKYFPIYIDWLTLKLQGQSSFGLLSIVGTVSVIFVLMYVFIRRGGDY